MNPPPSLLTLAARPARSRRGVLDPARALGYLRASTSKQAASPAVQLAAIKAWAAQNGVEVVAVFRDDATSGAADLDDRPGILAAIEALREQDAGLLVVAKRDRFARDRVIAGLLERLIEKNGAKLVSADGLSSGTGPEADLLRGVMDVFAEWERGVLRARTRAALAHRRAAGLRTGNIPFGFRLAPDRRHLVADPRETRVLDLIRRLRRTRSWRGVVDELKRRRVKNRSGRCGWSIGQVQRLAASPRRA